MADKSVLRDKLVGALVGLARATEGNEHLVTPEIDRLAIEALLKTEGNVYIDNESLEKLIEKVENTKAGLVPLCYECSNPCGRNDFYDLNNLWSADEDIQSLKLRILSGLRKVANHVYPEMSQEKTAFSINRVLYKGLFAIGRDDWGKEDLKSVLNEIDEISLTGDSNKLE